MPRFKEADKAAIRERLVIEGKKLFQRYGLKKTNVEDLARSAGIAKGTFYHFFESKEDLCLAIFDREEAMMETDIRAVLERPGTPAAALKGVMEYGVAWVRGDSLLTLLRKNGEIALLARGVPPAKLAEHLANDTKTTAALLAALRAKGAKPAVSAELLAGIMRAVVVIAFNEEMVGEKIFPAVIRLMSAWLAEGILKTRVRSQARGKETP